MLRKGLTNSQIAERLGITLDGAKYHVSQIISKLGASGREEAASVAIAGHRPWWMATFVPFGAISRRFPVNFVSTAAAASAGVVAAALVGFGVLAFLLLRTGNGDGSPSASSPTATPPQSADSFARQLDAALQAGDRQFFIDNVDYQDVACGTAEGPPGYPPSCQGLPAGSTSPGLPVSFLNSEGAYEDPGQYAERIETFFRNNTDLRLHATATRGLPTWAEFAQYDELADAIAAPAEPPADGTPRQIMVFTLGRDGESWRVVGLTVGAPEVFLDYDSVQPGDDWAGFFASWERWQG